MARVALANSLARLTSLAPLDRLILLHLLWPAYLFGMVMHVSCDGNGDNEGDGVHARDARVLARMIFCVSACEFRNMDGIIVMNRDDDK